MPEVDSTWTAMVMLGRVSAWAIATRGNVAPMARPLSKDLRRSVMMESPDLIGADARRAA
ncbi:hypothetical protein GCM10011320_49320 [Neoroseomonas lacus]|uniref:Uncharacterized protein n=1 Tax=Neoroseomonas lacus TaxID=287609 RepID=A0A917NWD8_9PROT|nr:hypothetical protein GCM10011320_49320 [Neoroseomonas lacus]